MLLKTLQLWKIPVVDAGKPELEGLFPPAVDGDVRNDHCTRAAGSSLCSHLLLEVDDVHLERADFLIPLTAPKCDLALNQNASFLSSNEGGTQLHARERQTFGLA